MIKIALLITTSVALLLLTPNADARDEVIDASKPKKLAGIIQDLGYKAKLSKDAKGDPLISSSVGGSQFHIVFYGCSERRHNKCKVLLFKVGYDQEDGTSLDIINEWNATKVFGRAYMDEERDPWLEMPLVMDGGVTKEQFENVLDVWESIVGDFEMLIGG